MDAYWWNILCISLIQIDIYAHFICVAYIYFVLGNLRKNTNVCGLLLILIFYSSSSTIFLLFSFSVHLCLLDLFLFFEEKVLLLYTFRCIKIFFVLLLLFSSLSSLQCYGLRNHLSNEKLIWQMCGENWGSVVKFCFCIIFTIMMIVGKTTMSRPLYYVHVERCEWKMNTNGSIFAMHSK